MTISPYKSFEALELQEKMMASVANSNLAQTILLEHADSHASQPVRLRIAHLLERAVFSAVLVLIVLTAIPYGTVESWLEAFFAAAVFALALLWLSQLLLSRSRLSNQHRLLLPLAALIVFALVQSLPFSFSGRIAAGIGGKPWQDISADPYRTQLVVLRLLALTLVAAMLLQYVSSQRRLHLLIRVVVGVAAASAAFGLWRQATGTPDFIFPHLKFWQSSYGQFINRNHFAFLMEMGLGLALGMMVGQSMRRRWRMIYLAAALVMWTALVLTTSRGAFFSMLSQAILLLLVCTVEQIKHKGAKVGAVASRTFWQMIKSVRVPGLLLGCVLIAILVSVLWTAGAPLTKRLATVPDEFITEDADVRTSRSRMAIWRATWQLIKANPIAGVGFGGYKVAISEYYGADTWAPQEAHNEYLELPASGGLIGAALAAWFILAFIGRVRDQLRAGDRFRRASCVGALVGLFGVGVHSLVDSGLQVPINAFVFTSLVVIATSDISRLHVVAPANNSGEPANRRLLRLAFALTLGLICFYGVWVAGTAGLSRVLSGYAKKTKSLAVANMAVNWEPSDPEAHYARAAVFSHRGELVESIEELERAVALRPRDYFLRLRLGRERDRAGDERGALAAFRDAVRLAPQFREPRLRLHNLLLKMGQRDEGFAELRLARVPTPNTIHLAETFGEEADNVFGWVLERGAGAVRVSQDTNQPFSGVWSLRLDFNGVTPPRIASQLVVVEPNTSYRLRFAARTQGMVTGNSPVVAVTDAGGDELVLGRSAPLPGSSGWQRYRVEFRAPNTTGAVLISIERPACGGRQLCPIFGQVWFDEFSLQKF